ncbi:MAG TPA: MFS transporter, partial [Nocardioides sp.]|nr:MFS transporter [Nocardioides sp.]
WTLLSLAAGVVLLGAFVLIESRVKHPLLPVRVFTNRTRAASFVAMFFAPAAMFAMFFYLSQYIQTVMGYSPLKAGVAFLPFCFGLVAAAGLSSNLVNRIDPRYLAGVGTLMAAAALYGFSRIPYDTTAPISNVSASYATDLLPFILMMSFGMGLTFVPLTLTAVHHLRNEDTGIGSGVLNTMQQVGGALGLSLLATLATQTITDRSTELGAAMADPIAQLQVFTEGASDAFLLGAGLMLVASLVTWIFLNVKHEELATDGPEVVHAGV